MTVDSKHDFHPDAESLNAFAEEALGPQERGGILAHLAECGRCREVVFLAQEAAAAMEMEMVPQLAVAAAAPQSTFFSKKKPWFKSWRIAWVPAGALAVVVTVAYVAHLRRSESISEVAKVEPATASQNQATAAALPVAPLVVRPPVAAAPGELAAKKVESNEPGSALKGRSSPATPPSGAVSSQVSSISDAAAPPPSPAPPTPGAATGFAPLPGTAAAQREQQQSEITMQAERSTAMVMPRAKTSDVAHRGSAEGTLAAAATQSKADANATSSGGFLAGGSPLAAGSFGTYKATPINLPSGLVAVSTASANRRQLAVDAEGGVFVSGETDGRWETVAKQWSGRAVTVRLQSAGESNSQKATPDGAVFEIVNERGQVWVSSNLKIWVAK